MSQTDRRGANLINLKSRAALFAASLCAAAAVASASHAADVPAPTAAPAPPPSIFTGTSFHVNGEFGIMGNSGNPADGQNVGQLYTDRANEPELNQIFATLTKPIDSSAKDYEFGFAVQALFGSDGRYNHIVGIGESVIKGRNQFGLYQAYVGEHLPVLFSGGVDVKVGVFASLEGVESTDASLNPFYSHSYLFNYGEDGSHTGVLTISHINPTLDLYLGVDGGNAVSYGNVGDPNRTPAGYVGFGLNNLMDGKLNIVDFAHIGPENPLLTDPDARKQIRVYETADVTYTITKNLTSVTELNYIHDDLNLSGNAGGSTGYGAAQYLEYNLNPHVSFNVRGEVFRDADGFYVLNFPANLDPVNLTKGYPNTAFGLTQPTTYSEVSLSLVYKPDVPKPLTLVLLRPEVRYDRALAGGLPYNPNAANVGQTRDQFTFGGDVIVGF